MLASEEKTDPEVVLSSCELHLSSTYLARTVVSDGSLKLEMNAYGSAASSKGPR